MFAFIFASTTVVVSIGVLVFVYYRIFRHLIQHGESTTHIRSSIEQEKRLKQEKITMKVLPSDYALSSPC